MFHNNNSPPRHTVTVNINPTVTSTVRKYVVYTYIILTDTIGKLFFVVGVTA